MAERSRRRLRPRARLRQRFPSVGCRQPRCCHAHFCVAAVEFARPKWLVLRMYLHSFPLRQACYHLMERERAVADASRVSLGLATTNPREEGEGAVALFGMTRKMAPALDHDLEVQRLVRRHGWLLETAFGSRVIRPLPVHLWLWQPDAVPASRQPPYDSGAGQCFVLCPTP